MLGLGLCWCIACLNIGEYLLTDFEENLKFSLSCFGAWNLGWSSFTSLGSA
uniref:Uncharacterized protein n=1 Tax=Anguilla anguilla TaxID=7936 RepID=A0A0E9XDT8_ANGAN